MKSLCITYQIHCNWLQNQGGVTNSKDFNDFFFQHIEASGVDSRCSYHQFKEISNLTLSIQTCSKGAFSYIILSP